MFFIRFSPHAIIVPEGNMLERVACTDSVDLAHEAPFGLGALDVDPPRLRICLGGECRQVEPKVMQVLVVLGRADGQVVSRAELVSRCWDGRIVGENAIQRVISRLRQMADATGAFEIETVTKVGYLLRPVGPGGTGAADSSPGDTGAAAGPAADETPVAPDPDPPRPSRRLLLGSALALSAAGIAAVVHWRLGASRDPNAEEARALLEKAREVRLQDLPEHSEQAIAYLERATELDSSNAEAWGVLALSHQNLLYAVREDELPYHADRARSAAEQALAIDADNVEARVALATIPPNFRNWARNERALRQIMAEHGSHPAAETALGWAMCDTGRWRDAIGCFRRALAFEPYHPGNQTILARGHWGHGQFAEADRILEKAHQLWPGHRGIWEVRLNFLAGTGRAGAARAMLEDKAAWPVFAPGDEPPPVEALVIFARAMETGSAADLAAANAAVGTADAPGPLGYRPGYLMALNRVDDLFAYAERFFFGGPGRPPPGSLSRRKSSFLFNHESKEVRRDPRFAGLVRRIGLQDYWRETGTRPDVPV